MPYLVRKLSNRRNIESIKKVPNLGEAYADTLNQEFKTEQNKLSMWFIEDMGNFENAALAIATNSGSFETMDFVAVDTVLLDKSQITYVREANDTPFEEYEDNHFDICNLTFDGLQTMLKIYKDKKTIHKRITGGPIKKMIWDAKEAGRINFEKARTEEIRDKLIELSKR